MINWFKRLLGLKTQPEKLPTNYDGLLKSDMLYERGTLQEIVQQLKAAKHEFEGIDNNVILQLIHAEDHVNQALEFLNQGLEDCYDDSMEDGEYPVFMSWIEDEK